jgi:uncharacterized repeat protein (TIGR03803 family)
MHERPASEGGLAMDSAGNIYAATEGAPGDCGAVVELSPSQSGWTETTIHTFEGDDGCSLAATPILDQAGNLYAITGVGGINDSGTLVEFTYTNGGWSESVRHAFSPENAGVKYGFATDSAGNFYGTTVTGGNGSGTVFKLTPSGNLYTESTLYVFTNQDDGNSPAGIVLDPSGNLFGTASEGGAYGHGTFWEITP